MIDVWEQVHPSAITYQLGPSGEGTIQLTVQAAPTSPHQQAKAVTNTSGATAAGSNAAVLPIGISTEAAAAASRTGTTTTVQQLSTTAQAATMRQQQQQQQRQAWIILLR